MDERPDGRNLASGTPSSVILTPDQRIRVFVSSTLEELADARAAVRRAVESLHQAPVLFELGARPHPPRSLYRSYLEQSHVFIGLYWQRYGWVAPGMEVSGLEDEYELSAGKPRLVYVKRPAPEREPRLAQLLDRIRAEDDVSYRGFETAAELEQLVVEDLAVLMSEAFQSRIAPPVAHDDSGHLPRLPTPPTALVGRKAELAELQELVRAERLVTLTGPGGIGKTRLAMQLASDLAPEFGDGAAFIELASVDRPEMVAAAVAQTLGVREEGPAGLVNSLKSRLAERSMLLVLDNFEHLMEATPFVSELTAIAPNVKVVVTSREALRLQAEHEFSVTSLPAESAVQLFLQRARSVRHGLTLDPAMEGMVDQIVAALEGVPLAIELAAAQVRLLPPQAILTRLDRRLDFLAAGARDLPERQRALRTTMDWSYDLLTEDDKRLFARLGVFAGSFSLAAVQAVAELPDEAEALTRLASLVDKSLLLAEASDREPRFRMLVMVRDYAREKSRAVGEAEAAGRCHAEFYRGLTTMLKEALRGPHQAEWVDRLDGGTGAGDVDNLRATLRWYVDRGELDAVAQMVWSMWLLGWISGRLNECNRWAREGLSARGQLSERGRARLLTVAGLFEAWKGEYDTSMPALSEGVAIARQLGDEDTLATALLGLAMVSSLAGGLDVARGHAEQAHALFRTRDDRWGQATSSSVLTWLLVAQDDFDASSVFEEALAVAADRADELNRSIIEANVAEYLLHRGDHVAAGRLLVSSLRRFRALRALYPSSYAIDGAARLAAQTGRADEAAMLLAGADRVRETIGVPVEGAHRSRRAGLLEAVRGDLGASFDRAVAEGRALRYEQTVDLASSAAARASRIPEVHRGTGPLVSVEALGSQDRTSIEPTHAELAPRSIAVSR